LRRERLDQELAPRRRGELGAELEELVLDAGQAGAELRRGPLLRRAEPEDGVELVDRPVGLDPEIVLAHAYPRQEVGLPTVAALGIDLHSSKLSPETGA